MSIRLGEMPTMAGQAAGAGGGPLRREGRQASVVPWASGGARYSCVNADLFLATPNGCGRMVPVRWFFDIAVWNLPVCDISALRGLNGNANMKYSKEQFLAYIVSTVKLMNTKRVTQGKVCAVASLRYIRDGLIDDLYGVKAGEKGTGDAADSVEAMRMCFKELIDQVNKEGADSGFASNASAAAKAAGLATGEKDVVADLANA
jgi:hypothetical protein